MKVFIQSIVAQILLNPYIFWRGYQAIPPKKSWRIPYILFFILELSIFFFGFTFRNVLPDSVMIAIQYICNTWYIASIYITLSLLGLEVLRLSNRFFHWFPGWITSHWKQTKLVLFFLVMAIVTGLMFHAYHVVAYPVVKDVYVTLPKGSSNRDSMTIVMMSDLHIGEMIGKELVQQYVKMSNAQHPDLVVLVGDIMDYESRFAEKAHIEENLKQLKAPLGVYVVYGDASDRFRCTSGLFILSDRTGRPYQQEKKAVTCTHGRHRHNQTDHRIGSSTLVVRRNDNERCGSRTPRAYP